MTVATGVAPRFRHVPTYSETAGQDCIDLAAAAGLELDGWQQDVLRDALAEQDGRWVSMRIGLVVPRQNGKGAILEALELFALFALEGCRLITHTAHRFDTCLDHFRRIRTLIEDTPDLLALVKDNGRGVGGMPSGIKDSNGKESIELRDGSRLNFKAREKGSGRGFSGDLVVLDEAFWLKDVSGLIPTMSARENPQLWYTSSAPLPRMESDRLRSLVREGRALAAGEAPAGPTLTYFEWSAPDGSGLDDPDALRAANPSTEVGRITVEFSAVERATMTDDEYARERLGMFPDDDERLWALFDEAGWVAGAVDDADDWLTGPYTYAVEIDPDRKVCALSIAGLHEDKVGVDTGWHGPYDEHALLAQIVAVKDTAKAIVIDPAGPAETLIRPLRELHGIEVREVTTAEFASACRGFYDSHTGEIAHTVDDEVLDASVAAATKRKYRDGWLLDRFGADSTAVIAAALAGWGHLEIPDPEVEPMVAWV